MGSSPSSREAEAPWCESSDLLDPTSHSTDGKAQAPHPGEVGHREGLPETWGGRSWGGLSSPHLPFTVHLDKDARDEKDSF